MEINLVRLPDVLLSIQMDHFQAELVAFFSHLAHDLVGQEVAVVQAAVVEVGVLELGHLVAEFLVCNVFLDGLEPLGRLLDAFYAG